MRHIEGVLGVDTRVILKHLAVDMAHIEGYDLAEAQNFLKRGLQHR